MAQHVFVVFGRKRVSQLIVRSKSFQTFRQTTQNILDLPVSVKIFISSFYIPVDK